MTVKELICHLRSFSAKTEVEGQLCFTDGKNGFVFVVQNEEPPNSEEQPQRKIGFVG